MVKITREFVSSTPSVGDIFVAVRKNKSETPYFISCVRDYLNLTNLHSGQTNYVHERDNLKKISSDLDALIEIYLKNNKDVASYYFLPRGDIEIYCDKAFGLTKVED